MWVFRSFPSSNKLRLDFSEGGFRVRGVETVRSGRSCRMPRQMCNVKSVSSGRRCRMPTWTKASHPAAAATPGRVVMLCCTCLIVSCNQAEKWLSCRPPDVPACLPELCDERDGREAVVLHKSEQQHHTCEEEDRHTKRQLTTQRGNKQAHHAKRPSIRNTHRAQPKRHTQEGKQETRANWNV